MFTPLILLVLIGLVWLLGAEIRYRKILERAGSYFTDQAQVDVFLRDRALVYYYARVALAEQLAPTIKSQADFLLAEKKIRRVTRQQRKQFESWYLVAKHAGFVVAKSYRYYLRDNEACESDEKEPTKVYASN